MTEYIGDIGIIFLIVLIGIYMLWDQIFPD
ncbi:hypothetical protein SAMN04490178_10518 [Propionispora vibrioides]|uniref:Uncharacterized protein n=1 Tax=Propionispora vibrioides TaxID=112903 RepID=A0A1H8SFA8_9FIRM|nr:hypothetical protein SAMN04490178_10518 [Propionispora vibrioides]